MNLTLKIYKTNWINVVSIFSVVYLFGIASELSSQEEEFFTSLGNAVLGGLYAIVYFGFLFWIGLLVLLLVFDSILIRNTNGLTWKLVLEWLIVSVPFLYWSFQFEAWVFVVGSITLFVSQQVRRRMIQDIFKEEVKDKISD